MADVVGGDDRHAVRAGEVEETPREPLAGAVRVALNVDREAVAEDRPQAVEVQLGVRSRERPLRAAGEAVEAGGVCLNVGPARLRGAFLATERGRAEEPAEIPVARPALDQEPEETRPGDRDPGTDERADARSARRLEEAWRAVDASPVGERERVVAERRGPFDEILGQRGAGEEAERAPAAELDVVKHYASHTWRLDTPPPAPGGSVVHAIHVPAARRAVAAVEPAVAQLEVVVVAREAGLAPPLTDHPPRAGRADDAAAEPRAADEVRPVAVAEDLDRARRAERAHDEGAAGSGAAVPVGVRRRERRDRRGTRPVRVDDERSADTIRAADRSELRDRRREAFRGRSRGMEEAELRGPDALRRRGDRDPDDRGPRQPGLEVDPHAAEERLRVAGRRGQGDGALVAAPVLQVECHAEPRDADAVEPDPRDGAVEKAAENEQQRLHRIDGELEPDRLLDRAADRLRRERARILAARRVHERRARRTEPRRHLRDRQACELAETVDAPARERRRERRVRGETCERQRREEADLRPWRHDLDPVERREPRHDHARRDGGPGGEPDPRGACSECSRERGLARDEVGGPGGIEKDRAVGRRLDAARERCGDIYQRAHRRALGGIVARPDEEIARDRSRLRHRVSRPDAALARGRRRGHDRGVAPRAVAQRERAADEGWAGTTGGRDGKLRDEEACDARHPASGARLPHDERPPGTPDAAPYDRERRLDPVQHDQSSRAAVPADAPADQLESHRRERPGATQ